MRAEEVPLAIGNAIGRKEGIAVTLGMRRMSLNPVRSVPSGSLASRAEITVAFSRDEGGCRNVE